MDYYYDRSELLVQEKPIHDHGKYFCACIVCDRWRAVRVVPGKIVVPATHDPNKCKPGTIPAWNLGGWRKTGWDFRMESHGITWATVMCDIDKNDTDNGGHFDCVVLLVAVGYLLVTSRKWLHVVG